MPICINPFFMKIYQTYYELLLILFSFRIGMSQLDLIEITLTLNVLKNVEFNFVTKSI
jgi:hypothetical protein